MMPDPVPCPIPRQTPEQHDWMNKVRQLGAKATQQDGLRALALTFPKKGGEDGSNVSPKGV